MHAHSIVAYVALGANLGDAEQTVQSIISQLARLPHTQLTSASSLYRSAPIDSSGPDYINAVAQLATVLPAPVLLAHLQHLENAAQRQRPYRNAPRTLDLDLLLYGSATIDSAALTVPHPRMYERAFVLQPLAEIAPQLVSPRQLQQVSQQQLHRFLLP